MALLCLKPHISGIDFSDLFAFVKFQTKLQAFAEFQQFA